jgi:hypothetical protein
MTLSIDPAAARDLYSYVPHVEPSSESGHGFTAVIAAVSAAHAGNTSPGDEGLTASEKAQADALATSLSVPKPLIEKIFGGVIAMASENRGKLTDEGIIRRIKDLEGPVEQVLNSRGLQRVLREIKENIPPDELANPLPDGERQFKPDGTPSEFSSLTHDAAHLAGTVYHAVTGFADTAGSAVSHHVAEATGLGVAGVVAGGIVTGAIDLGGLAVALF